MIILKEMKKQILALVLLIISTQVFSQFSVFSEYFPYNKKTEVYPIISNSDKGLPILFISGKNVKVYYFADDFTFQREINIKRSIVDSREYLGSYMVDNSLVIMFSDKKMNLISQLLVNLSTGVSKELLVYKHEHDQKYLASWEVLDSLFVLSIVENSSVLIVRKFFGLGKTATSNFNIGSNHMDNSSLVSRSSLSDIFDNQGGKPQKIDPSIPVSLKTASAKNKIYLVDDKIIITLDDNGNATKLITLNLIDNSHDIANFAYVNYQPQQPLPTSYNSFIYDNTIFQISINKNEIGMRIVSLGDTNRVALFQTKKDADIAFLNSTLSLRNEKEGFLFGNPVVTEIRTTRKFLKMASKMSPAISVFSNHLNYQILMGGVMDIHQSAGVMSNTVVSSGGDMMVSPNGSLAMPDPDYNFPTNYSFTSYASRMSASFSSNIDTSSYCHSDSFISKYTYDYIIKYANYMPGRFGLVTVFKIKGDYYLGYYSYSNMTYNIEWFKNIDDYLVQH